MAARLAHETVVQRLLAVDVLRLCLALSALGLALGALASDRFPGRSALPPEASGVRGGRGGPIAWPVLVLILAVAAAARIVGLGGDLWIDEIATLVVYLRRPPWQVVQTYLSANQHLLYSVLGSLSLHALGESPWAIRLPALLFGIGGVAALYFLGRRLAPPREALLASALLALSYHHVWFSQSARGYTAMIFWCLLGTILFLRGLGGAGARTWAGYVAAMTLGILSHQNTAFVLVGHVAAYALSSTRWPEWRTAHPPLTRRVAAAVFWVTVLSVAGHAFVLPQMVEFFLTVDRTGLGFSDARELFAVAAHGLRLSAAALPVVALGLAGMVSYWRQSPLMAGLLGAPLAIHVAALALLRYGAYPRSFLYVLPLALLILVRGMMVGAEAVAARMPARLAPGARRWLPAALALFALIGSGGALAFDYRYPKQDFTGALRYVEAHRRPGDVVSAVGLAATCYRVYYAPRLAFPGTAAELRALRQGEGDVWVLYSFRRDMRLRFPALLEAIDRDFRVEARLRGTLGDGDLYVARSGPAPRDADR